MYDKELVVEILIQIKTAIVKVNRRFENINSVDDFTNTPEGTDKLDSICMMLITIGESVKNIDKISDRKLLVKYPEIDWKGVKGMRDIISHHYFDIDAEEIFWVCDHKIPSLFDIIENMIVDLDLD